MFARLRSLTEIDAMDFISNVRLKQHKALEVGDLVCLRKVNVICGANNSGKTTILEKLASGNEVRVAEAFVWDDNNRDQLLLALDKRSSAIRVHGSTQTPRGFLHNATDLNDALRLTVKHFPALFDDDGERFARILIENAIAIHTEAKESSRHFPYDLLDFCRTEGFKGRLQTETSKLLGEYFTERFYKEIHPSIVVLVTPKRRLLASTPLEFSGEVKPDGEGLVQLLFFLKSKLPDTRERKFFEKYWEAFQQISGSIKFDIELEAESSQLKLYFSSTTPDQWRFAEDCGLGLRELMVILYFALEDTKQLVLIEEPENHLHPEMQRRLLWYLKEKTAEQKQFILSTHSSVFLDNNFVDRIYQTSLVDRKIVIEDSTSKARLLNDLGYSVSDNLVSDLIIVVEGSGDKNAITEFLLKKKLMGVNNIKFWILNGDAMGNVDLEAFADRFQIRVLLDNDPHSELARRTFVAQCRRLSIPITILQRYSLENYFPIEVYRESFGDLIPKRVTTFKPDAPVWSQLGSRIKRTDIKKGSKKFAVKTTLADIEGTDLSDFLDSLESLLAK